MYEFLQLLYVVRPCESIDLSLSSMGQVSSHKSNILTASDGSNYLLSFPLLTCSFPLSFLPVYVFVWAGDDGVAWSYNPGPQGDHGGGRNLLPGPCHGDPHSHHPAPQDRDVSLCWMAISNTPNTRIHIQIGVKQIYLNLQIHNAFWVDLHSRSNWQTWGPLLVVNTFWSCFTYDMMHFFKYSYDIICSNPSVAAIWMSHSFPCGSLSLQISAHASYRKGAGRRRPLAPRRRAPIEKDQSSTDM